MDEKKGAGQLLAVKAREPLNFLIAEPTFPLPVADCLTHDLTYRDIFTGSFATIEAGMGWL